MKSLFSFFFLFITAALCAWDIKTGTYELVGTNASGGTYHGEVVIAPQGKNYTVIWLVGSRQAQIGVGVHRSWEDVFSVAFADHARSYWGVVSYKVGAWGELEGRWTSSDGRGQGTEKLKWINSAY